LNDLYRQKLEKENQELLQQIAAIEAENAKLREDIEKADKPKIEIDLTEQIKNDVQKEIDEEFLGRLNTSATQILLEHRLKELTKKYSNMYVQHKLSSPINPRFTINEH
jgi:hypothetical protein